jgi:hypothetical protein
MPYTQSTFRISLWDTTGTGRGRGSLKATIKDAKYIGVSSYLNEGGEMFFTLPYNHPQISQCLPLERHYSVERFDEDDLIYRTIGNGILQDYVATDDEVVFYGIDYMTVLNQTLTDPTAALGGATVTYDNKTLGYIVQAELSAAKAATNSRLGFINIEATINGAATTYDIFTAGETRTDFIRNVCAIAQEGLTTKVVFGNRIETETTSYNSFFIDQNYSTATNNKLTLSYGGNVKRFSYTPNFKSLRTKALLISTNQFLTTSSRVWSSVATSALASTYGVIERLDIQQDVVSSASATKKAAQNLYESSPDKIKEITVAISDGAIIPYKDYQLGDDIRIIINRGPVSLNTNLTLRGQEWVGREDGSESLTFDFYNRNQTVTEVSPYKDDSSIKSAGGKNRATPSTMSGPDHLSDRGNTRRRRGKQTP